MGAPQKPPALKRGQTIGIVAPSSRLPEPERLQRAAERLEALGYRVRLSESCGAAYGYLAGSDEQRAEAINRMFRDDTVDAILCARGGYGATRILPLLNYDAIRSNPKLFSGYSDVTALHSALLAKANLATFHGLMAVPDFGADETDAYSLSCFFRAVSEGEPPLALDNPPGFARETILPGRAEGPLVGGNLTLVASCLATPYAFPFKGAVLFLEEVSERSYACDRLLTQLRNAGVFEDVAAVLLGAFTGCEPDEKSRDLRLRQIFDDVFKGLGKPVLSGVRFGHCREKMTLPLAVPCRVDADARTLSLLESAVE